MEGEPIRGGRAPRNQVQGNVVLSENEYSMSRMVTRHGMSRTVGANRVDPTFRFNPAIYGSSAASELTCTPHLELIRGPMRVNHPWHPPQPRLLGTAVVVFPLLRSR